MTHFYLKKLAVAAALAMVCAPASSAWSTKGHQIIAYIAKRHLTPTAWDRSEELLGGSNIVYWSTWLDQARNDPDYEHTSTWHYINVDEGEDYDNRYINPLGDAVYAIEVTAEVIADPRATDDEKNFALKVLTHVVGDLHQPMHAGHQSDLGGNYITIYYNGRSKKLHAFWDYDIVEAAHSNWSYYDWQTTLDHLPADVEAEIVAGTPNEWGRESVGVAAAVYKDFPAYCNVTQQHIDRWREPTEMQMLRGGLRLARLINEGLDPDFVGVEEVEADAAPDVRVDVFTLTGVCVRKGVSRFQATDGLAPGIYIVGGKKIAVTR